MGLYLQRYLGLTSRIYLARHKPNIIVAVLSKSLDIYKNILTTFSLNITVVNYCENDDYSDSCFYLSKERYIHNIRHQRFLVYMYVSVVRLPKTNKMWYFTLLFVTSGNFYTLIILNYYRAAKII